jgi:hypothetical protein
MIAFPSRVRFLTCAEGGTDGQPWNGMMPSFGVHGQLVACIVTFPLGAKLASGQSTPAVVSVCYGEKLDADAWAVGRHFQLNFASQVIAHGVVTGTSTQISTKEDAFAMAELLFPEA